MTSPPTPPTTPRRNSAQGSLAFDRASGMFVAKAPSPPVKSPPTGLSGILLPHARSRWVLPAAAGMTPATIESILKEALTGKSPRREQELYSLMLSTWPRLMKNLEELKNAVLGLDWQLMEPAEELRIPGAKELARRTMDGMKGDPETDGLGWRDTLSSLLDAWPRGISVSEIEWEYRAGQRTPPAWLPRITRDLPPWHYGWRTSPMGSSGGDFPENDGRLVLYPDATGQNGIPFPPHKFIIAIRKAGKGHPSGTALLRCLAWWWSAANFSAEWLLNFAQIFGQPFRWATYQAGDDGVKAELSTMMQEMGSAAWGIGPDSAKLEWHESAKSGADNPQAHMLTLADTAADLLILGQTLTSTQGDKGSQALGTVHQSVRADVIDAAAGWLAGVLNEQLIPSIVSINLGDRGEDSALPWFQAARKDKKDTKVLADTFKVIIDAGIPLKKDEVYDALDMSEPKDGDRVFGGVAASSGVSGAILTALAAAGLRVTDEGIRQLSESVQISIERDPNAGAGGIPAEAPPDMRRMLAKLPLDAREYFLARLG